MGSTLKVLLKLDQAMVSAEVNQWATLQDHQNLDPVSRRLKKMQELFHREDLLLHSTKFQRRKVQKTSLRILLKNLNLKPRLNIKVQRTVESLLKIALKSIL